MENQDKEDRAMKIKDFGNGYFVEAEYTEADTCLIGRYEFRLIREGFGVVDVKHICVFQHHTILASYSEDLDDSEELEGFKEWSVSEVLFRVGTESNLQEVYKRWIEFPRVNPELVELSEFLIKKYDLERVEGDPQPRRRTHE